MEREAHRERVIACSICPAVFVSKFRGALQAVPYGMYVGPNVNTNHLASNAALNNPYLGSADTGIVIVNGRAGFGRASGYSGYSGQIYYGR